MKQPYPYSNELKSVSVNSNYDMAELALSGRLGIAAKFIKKQTTQYKSKIANIRLDSYSASDGATIPFYEFTPKNKQELYPAIIYYHGGGFMFPIQKAMMNNSALYAANCGAKVFLPEYRIAPDVSCNTIIEDCYDMLKYVFEHAEVLHVNPNQVLVYGDSAGGCLAASVTLLNRERNAYPLRAQMLIYPVCDNESDKYPSMEQYKNAAWTCLLYTSPTPRERTSSRMPSSA